MCARPTGDARRALLAAADAEAAREAFDTLFETVRDRLLLVDAVTGGVLRATPSAMALLRAPDDDRPVHLRDVLQRSRVIGRGEAVPSGRQRLQTPDGPLDVTLEVQTLRNGRGDGTTALVRIVPDADPSAVVADERDAPALSALEELSRELSAHIGTQLTLTLGNAELLLRRIEDDHPSEVAAAAAVLRHASEASRGVTQLVARSRALLGGTGPTDVAELVDWIERLVRDRLVDRDLRIVDDSWGGDPPAVDATVLRQVLLNVVLELTAPDRGLPPGDITLKVTPTPTGTVVRLTHPGPPVLDAADRALKVSRELVLENGGTWTTTGSSLLLTLPEDHHGTRRDPAAVPTVVVVDDDPGLVALVRRALGTGRRRYRLVGSAGTVAAAVTLLRDERPDVVLLDQELPDGLGTSHIGRLRAASPTSTFVLLSAHEPTRWLAEADMADVAWLDKFRSLASLPDELERVSAGTSGG